MCFKFKIVVQGICPLKIYITQFPYGFCLNLSELLGRHNDIE